MHWYVSNLIGKKYHKVYGNVLVIKKHIFNMVSNLFAEYHF